MSVLSTISDSLKAAGRSVRSAFSVVDATDQSKRRRTYGGSVKSVDAEVTDRKRQGITQSARGVQRNFEVAAWAIRKHLDFVAAHNFRPKTGDRGLDRTLQELMEWWSRPLNFDAAGRHGLHRFVRLAEACRCIDGDMLALKLSDGRVQAIEGDRVKTPQGNHGEVVNGVRVAPGGRALSYAIHRRKSSGGLEFERWLSASRVVHHGFFERFDQVRGVSPLSASLNRFEDVYENFDYALARAKVAQLFGLVFYRDATEGAGNVINTGELGEDDGDGDEQDEGYDVKLGTRPLVLDLDPGDKAEFLENKTPAVEFQQFTATMLAVALKSLDLPYSFFDESFTNFFGSMAALQLYVKSCAEKRRDVREMLRQLTVWRLGLFIADGDLVLPSGYAGVGDLDWEWIPNGLPWWRPGEEIRADVMAVHSGLRTRSEIRKERFGDEWQDVIEQLAVEEQTIRDLGVTIVAPGPSVFNPPAEVKQEGDDA